MIKNKFVDILLFFTGFWGFSVLGQEILLNEVKLPIALMEVFYLPIALLYSKSILEYIKSFVRQSNKVLIAIFYFIGIALIATVLNGGDVIALRSAIYLIISTDFFKKKNGQSNLNHLFLLFLGAMFGEAIFRFVMDTTETMSSMNCLALAGCIFSAYSLGKYGIMFVISVIELLFSINTGYRIGIIVVISSLVVVFVHIIFGQKRKDIKTFKQALTLSIILIAWIIFREHYLEIINMFAKATHMGSFATFRVTMRLMGLFERNTALSQDSARGEMYKLVLTSIPSHILPHGIVRPNGDYIDVPMLFLYDAFGSILSVVGVVRYCIITVQMFVGTLTGKDDAQKMLGTTLAMESIVIMLLIVVNGTFLKSAYQAIMTGMIIGTMLKVNKEKKL